MPAMKAVAAIRRQFEFRHLSESLVVPVSDLDSPACHAIQPPELLDTDCGHYVAHVVFEPALYYFVVPVTLLAVALPRVFTDPVQIHNSHALLKAFVRGGDHPALAG